MPLFPLKLDITSYTTDTVDSIGSEQIVFSVRYKLPQAASNRHDMQLMVHLSTLRQSPHVHRSTTKRDDVKKSDKALYDLTVHIIKETRRTLSFGNTATHHDTPRCNACSLIDIASTVAV